MQCGAMDTRLGVEARLVRAAMLRPAITTRETDRRRSERVALLTFEQLLIAILLHYDSSLALEDGSVE